jgi:hypothetical protein
MKKTYLNSEEKDAKNRGDFELEKLRHIHHLDEIEAKKQAELLIENLKHDHEMESARIKEAGIKRTIAMKQDRDFANSYSGRGV